MNGNCTAATDTKKNLSVKDLCERNIWKGKAQATAFWVLWFQNGVLLALFRLLILIIFTPLSLCLPLTRRRQFYRYLLLIMGIRIRCNLSWDEAKKHTDGCVVALNHISIFDHFPVLAMPGATVMVDHSDSVFGRAVGFLLFKGSGSTYWRVSNVKQIVKNFRHWHKSPEGTALYITPEATINNGRGLFRFRPEFMIRGRPVVPLAMKLSVPFGLTPNPLMSSGAAKFLRLIMSPCLTFNLDFLPPHTPMQRYKDKQAEQAFADGVQNSIAEHLDIPATHFTREDKYLYREEVSRERHI